MRILLVDDNEELREFLALTLTESDVEVVATGDPQTAIHHVEDGKFDGFVIDSVLDDGSDGLTLLAQLRNLKHGKSVPVLFMSNISTSLARRMAQSAGVKEFLVKPFGQMQFVEQVKSLR
jgi:DNA-binding response OmpR family regulator